MAKALLVGGHPKGYPEPFSPNTMSGRRLRKIVPNLEIDVEYFDLWENEEQEQIGYVLTSAINKLIAAHSDGRVIVALGHRVYNTLVQCPLLANIPIVYLPHPAARNITHLQRLRNGLADIAKRKTP